MKIKPFPPLWIRILSILIALLTIAVTVTFYFIPPTNSVGGNELLLWIIREVIISLLILYSAMMSRQSLLFVMLIIFSVINGWDFIKSMMQDNNSEFVVSQGILPLIAGLMAYVLWRKK